MQWNKCVGCVHTCLLSDVHLKLRGEVFVAVSDVLAYERSPESRAGCVGCVLPLASVEILT